jgi:phenylacetate-CoA ligase
MGRQRNMLTLPDGRQFWPSFPAHDWSSIGTIRQMQLVQTGTQQIVANLVTGVPLSGDEEGRLINFLQARFRHPFAVEIRYHDRIERSKGGKFEDFISLV